MLKDARMEAIYSLVRQGAVVCDIGTDHALIPLALVSNGVCPRAVMTDISLPSLGKGERNVSEAGLSDRISAFRADGTLGADIAGVTDFVIAGMGGELIVKILSQDERLHVPGLRFILQPMTKAPELRRYLSSGGFRVLTEKRALADGRIYAVILAEYDGVRRETSVLSSHIGEYPDICEPLQRAYCEKVLDALRTKYEGLKKAATVGETAEATASLIREIEGLTGFAGIADASEKNPVKTIS